MVDHTSSLPDLLLRDQILARLPLGAILRLHQVCRRWAKLQKEHLATVTTLTILVGEDDAQHTFGRFTFAIPYIEELAERPQFLTDHLVNHNRNRLVFHWLDVHSARIIAHHLPNVTSLTLSLQMVPPVLFRGVRAWGHRTDLTQSLAVLFSRWAPFLRALKYYTCFRYDDDEHFTESIHEHVRFVLGAINSCHRLKHLTFELNNPVYLVKSFGKSKNHNDKLLRTIDLPVFGWLEDLYFNCWSFSGEALKNLLRYGLKNARLTSINFSDFFQPSFSTFLRKKRFRSLTKRFHQLAYYNLNLSSSEADLIGRHFTAIRRLNVSLQSALEFSQMIAFMGWMEGLLYVDLYIYFDHEEEEWRRMAGWQELTRKEDEMVLKEVVEGEEEDEDEDEENVEEENDKADAEKDGKEETAEEEEEKGGKEAAIEEIDFENFEDEFRCFEDAPRLRPPKKKKKFIWAARSRRNELPLPLQPKSAPSVKILKFYAPQATHETVHLVRWAEVLPSLEVLHFTDRQGCELCRQAVIALERVDREEAAAEAENPAPRAEEAEAPEAEAEAEDNDDGNDAQHQAAVARQVDAIWEGCLRRTLAAWADCPALRKVITNSRDDANRRWTAEELRRA